METLHFDTADGPRTALVTLPSAREPRPLVVMLHGTGGSAGYAAVETGWEKLATAREFAVAFPEGLTLKPAEPPRFLTNPQRWNDGSTRPGGAFHTASDDVGFLAALIRTLADAGRIDPARVYVTGFSNGAGMAFRFTAERPELIAAVAPVAGYCPASYPPGSTDVPTLFLIGDADLLIPLHGGTVRLPWGDREVERPTVAENLTRWAAALGSEPAATLESVSDGVTAYRFAGPVEFRQIVVAGLGHHWPGGKGQFNPRIAGPHSDRLDATARLWDFFARHRRA